jgi:hypothetical protein
LLDGAGTTATVANCSVGGEPCRALPLKGMANGHRTAELRSIELHRLVAEHLRREPELLLDRARDRVARWIEDGGPVPPSVAVRWRTLLGRPLPVIVAALVDDCEEMRDLRQSSPFAGALSQDERVQVIREHPRLQM